MKPVIWMVVASMTSWLAASLVFDERTSIEVMWGMLGPLLAVAASWVLMERTYRQHPESTTAVMVAGFAAKLVFFGAYVTVMLWGLSLRPVPFVLSFTSYFIVLYLIEALYLRRLFWGGMRASR